MNFQEEQRADCVESIVVGLTKTSDFRSRKARQYPDDKRNAKSEVTLRALANDATELTDPEWELLQLFYDPESRSWQDAICQATIQQQVKKFPVFHTQPDCVVAAPTIGGGITIMTIHDRDSSVLYWRSNVDVDSLFAANAHRPDRAQSWLRYRNVSESCFGFERAVMMKGHFEGGILGNSTYHWTFTPGRKGGLALVLPVFNDYRLTDFVAMSRHNHEVWGACTGAGQYVGDLAVSPLRVYRTPAEWLANDCDGVLPLSKAFFPLLQNAPKLIAVDDDHAWDLAKKVFIDPAAKFGCDEGVAEDMAYERIEVAA